MTDAGVQEVANAVATAGMTDEQAKARLDEENVVRKFFKQFDEDQKFDEPIRKQIRKDRNYASGDAQANWAVSTNLIGSAIDILVATLYARDPDVSVRPAPQVDPPPDPVTQMTPPQPERQKNQDFAKSMELVLSSLWHKGKLKPRMRRVIRSILSASHGWLKVLPATEMQPEPLAQNEYNTLQENVASVAAQIKALEDGQTLEGQTASVDDLTAQKAQLEASMEALSHRLEVEYCYGFTFDVVKPENMQVGTDVELLEEYCDSGANVEIMYFPHDELRQMFPDLTAEDLQAAEKYYRTKPKNANRGEISDDSPEGQLIARMYPNQGATEDLYTKEGGEEGSRPFAKILEKWCKTDNHIYTAIRGVKVWARKPYMPDWGTSRFYPWFYFSINEVDGQRCPQSLSSRGAKLQDEYASVRSNLRITRRRSIPSTIVDAAGMSDEELKKVTSSTIAEFVPVRTTGAPGQVDVSKLFAEKPVPNIDIRLYDTTPVVQDFERTMGVQEALQQVTSQDKTATEAEIQQSGYNTRTSTWRDTIETTLSEMAQYCAEIAIQKIKPEVAMKIAGPAVYWPYGMSLEDITSMVEINITAGTTGKPRSMGDREAWGVILPQLRETVTQIAQLEATPGGAPLANALKEQVRETMRRFGDESDLSRFFPAPPAAMTAPGGGPPGAPGAPGAGPPAAAGGPLPPEGAAPTPPPAVNPMQEGMAANGFLGAP